VPPNLELLVVLFEFIDLIFCYSKNANEPFCKRMALMGVLILSKSVRNLWFCKCPKPSVVVIRGGFDNKERWGRVELQIIRFVGFILFPPLLTTPTAKS
jgi:hypothetical protein